MHIDHNNMYHNYFITTKKKTENLSAKDSNIEGLLLEQIKYLNAERCSIQSSFLSIISISLAAYGLILYYAISFDKNSCQNINYIFILLPFLFSLSFYNIIKYTVKMLGIGAYICHLEKQINDLYNKPIFIWQSNLIHANGYGAIGGIAQAPCFLAISVFLGIKYIENIKKLLYPVWIGPLFTVLLSVELLILFFMLLVCITEAKSVEYWCSTISSNYTKITSFHTRGLHWIRIWRKNIVN